MDKRPAIVLAYANNQESRLAHLVKEMTDTGDELLKIDYEVKIITIYDADIEKIRTKIDEYKESIVAFMFSGHSGQLAIKTTGHAMSAIGLANCLAACPALKLIFINGCSSAGQIEHFKQTRASNYIFTESPIEDQAASDFATTFWKRMALENTIDEAFEIAFRNAQAFNGNIKSQKSRFLDEFEPKGDDLNKWILSQNENEEWSLRDEINAFNEKPAFEVNKLLKRTLHAELSKTERDIRGIKDFDSARGEIYAKFPQFFSKYIHDLCAPPPPQSTMSNEDDSYSYPNLKRLKKIIDFYLVIKEITKALTLAEIRENLISQETADFAFSDSWLTDDVENVIFGINWLRSAGKQTVFTQELISLDLKIFLESAQYFEETKKQVALSEKPDTPGNEKLSPKQLQAYCEKAEFHLVELLKEVIFIKNYKLVTIKQMTVYKNRAYEEVVFGFSLFSYEATDFNRNDPKEFIEEEIKLMAPDTFSILLIRKIDPDMTESLSTGKYLNLSPFLIDNNTLFDKAKIPNISFWESIENDSITYKTFYVPDQTKLRIKEDLDDPSKNRFYDNLKLQFDHFFSLIPNSKSHAAG